MPTEKTEIHSPIYANDLTSNQFYWKFEAVENEYKCYNEEWTSIDGVSYNRRYITPTCNLRNKRFSNI